MIQYISFLIGLGIDWTGCGGSHHRRRRLRYFLSFFMSTATFHQALLLFLLFPGDHFYLYVRRLLPQQRRTQAARNDFQEGVWRHLSKFGCYRVFHRHLRRWNAHGFVINGCCCLALPSLNYITPSSD